MKLQDKVRIKMNEALKSGNHTDRVIYSMLVNALAMKEKENKSPLTDDQEIEVVSRLVKQTKESIDTANGRQDIIDKFSHELEIYSQYMPKQMSEQEIRDTIVAVMQNLNIIDDPSVKYKGMVMKALMPIVKGKADGKLVNSIVMEYLK